MGSTRATLKKILQRYECPQITYTQPPFPIFIQKARGTKVWDSQGNRYTDWTSFFGTALLGHNNPYLLKRIRQTLFQLLAGMGDVHPPVWKGAALKEITAHLKLRGYQTILGLNGSDAIESLWKTIVIATGSPKIIVFEGSYHGLSLGALSLTSWKRFRTPFKKLLHTMPTLPFPESEALAQAVLKKVKNLFRQKKEIGGVLIEPVQGRGGIRIPPPGFLKELAALCHRYNRLFCTDEVFSGFFRCGFPLYTQKEKLLPDAVAVGKAMGNGFPVSACLARREIMQCWGSSTGEAIHTSTFLGHPLACAAALAVCQRQQQMGIASIIKKRAKQLSILKQLQELDSVYEVRGEGLMWGIEVVQEKRKRTPDPEKTAQIIREGLEKGFILLPAGLHGNILSLTPPSLISQSETQTLFRFLQESLCS